MEYGALPRLVFDDEERSVVDYTHIYARHSLIAPKHIASIAETRILVTFSLLSLLV